MNHNDNKNNNNTTQRTRQKTTRIGFAPPACQDVLDFAPETTTSTTANQIRTTPIAKNLATAASIDIDHHCTILPCPRATIVLCPPSDNQTF